MRSRALRWLLACSLPVSGGGLGAMQRLSVVPGAEGPRLELAWDSATGFTYRVEATDDLRAPFEEVTQGLEATLPLNRWTTALPAPGTRRFYRLAWASVQGRPNAVPNAGFDGGATGWDFQAKDGAAGTVEVRQGELVVSLLAPGPAASSARITREGLVLVPGAAYRVGLTARAASARTLTLRVQGAGGGTTFASRQLSVGTSARVLRLDYVHPGSAAPEARLAIDVGGSAVGLVLDDVEVVAGGSRDEAHELNRRLGRGANFMAAKAIQGQGAPEDAALLRSHGFSHCRLGYKLNEFVVPADDYVVPPLHLARVRQLAQWCLDEGLIAVVDPIHHWAADPGYTPADDGSDGVDDQRKLRRIWEQVAAALADMPLDGVLFESMNEPREEDDAGAINRIALEAIRSVPANLRRIVILPGDGFSTRQALIDALGDGDIPADDPFVIGTFHYYDPFAFTRQGENPSFGVSWGTADEFAEVVAKFDAVVAANAAFAASNATAPLPIYLGEFGVDNAADLWNDDRERWLSWVRMQAEARGFPWAHWNMYNAEPDSKGMGPWTATERDDPSRRRFFPWVVEALVGSYEFEAGSRSAGVAVAAGVEGASGGGAMRFPAGITGTATWARVDGIYLPRADTYRARIRYASERDRHLRLVTAAETRSMVRFPATGPAGSWGVLEVDLAFLGSTSAELGNDSLKVVATPDDGPLLDRVSITAAP